VKEEQCRCVVVVHGVVVGCRQQSSADGVPFRLYACGRLTHPFSGHLWSASLLLWLCPLHTANQLTHTACTPSICVTTYFFCLPESVHPFICPTMRVKVHLRTPTPFRQCLRAPTHPSARLPDLPFICPTALGDTFFLGLI
jgi:hypothetical protein